MAKRKGESGEGFTFTSGILRHVNSQTTGADATDVVAEAIPTPGYSESGKSGCYIVAAQLSPKPNTQKLNDASDATFTTQIQVGDKSASPAVVDPDDVAFFAQLIQSYEITTSGGRQMDFPKPIPLSMPIPIVVMPYFTIAHVASQNVANFQSAEVFTEIFYRTVRISERAYMSLLLQQQRQS